MSPQTREDWVNLFGIPECEVVEEAPAANVDLDDGEQPTSTNTTNEEILEIKKKQPWNCQHQNHKFDRMLI
jgi:hypothetical protein